MHTWIAQAAHLFTGEISRVALIVILYVIFGLFEALFSAQRIQTIRGKLRNIIFTFFYIVGGVLIMVPLSLFFPISTHHLPEHAFIISLAIVVEYIFLVDFFFYWYHRMEHGTKFLWAIHELHHSDGQLNVSTSMRSFFLERPLQVFVIFIPVNYLVGVDPLGIKVIPVILLAWLFFAHANIRLQLGVLTPFICGPQMHRIHHSNLPEHKDKNFAQFFPFIDIVFGTYFAPRPNEFPTTGTAGLSSDVSFAGAYLKPLRSWVGQVLPSNATAA